MTHRSSLAAAFTVAAAAAAAYAPGEAGATTYSGTGWVQVDKSASSSASTTIKGNDFSIGYTAFLGLDGYNWDISPDTVSVSCTTYIVKFQILPGIYMDFPVIESLCPTLPGTKLSSSTVSSSTTYQGSPATKQVTTIVWDVPDAGRLAKVDGYFKVPVTLFDEDFDLFKLTASGTGASYASDSVSSAVYVLGAKLDERSASLPATKRIVNKCLTLAEAEAEFEVVGIPIIVTASSDGCIYVDVGASWASSALTGTVTPGASVDATLKAGIGADIGVASASAGVYGTITVVDASLPLSLSAAVGTSGVTVTESAKLTMTGLDGEVGLYAEACFLGFCDEDTVTIFDWTGLTYANASIFSASQTISY